MKSLKTITFVYVPREDRILAAINHGTPDAWSCWLTRRLVLALLQRTETLVSKTSVLAQRAPADIRGQMIEFERDAAMAKTARAMSPTPPNVLPPAETAVDLLERIDITPRGDRFQLALRGRAEAGVGGVVSRAELERILQMLKGAVDTAGWAGGPTGPPAAEAPAASRPKAGRH